MVGPTFREFAVRGSSLAAVVGRGTGTGSAVLLSPASSSIRLAAGAGTVVLDNFAVDDIGFAGGGRAIGGEDGAEPVDHLVET